MERYAFTKQIVYSTPYADKNTSFCFLGDTGPNHSKDRSWIRELQVSHWWGPQGPRGAAGLGTGSCPVACSQAEDCDSTHHSYCHVALLGQQSYSWMSRKLWNLQIAKLKFSLVIKMKGIAGMKIVLLCKSLPIKCYSSSFCLPDKYLYLY